MDAHPGARVLLCKITTLSNVHRVVTNQSGVGQRLGVGQWFGVSQWFSPLDQKMPGSNPRLAANPAVS